VLWRFPSAAEALVSAWHFAGDAASRSRAHLLADFAGPFWLLYLLLFLSSPAIYRALKFVFVVFMRHVLRKDPARGPYARYRRDTFHDIPWTWDYSLQREPVNIWCECPECRTTLVYEYSSHRGEATLHCETCDRDLQTLEGNIDYLKAKTRRLIEKKIKTGEWEETVEAGKKG
jgi:hypothetical protein